MWEGDCPCHICKLPLGSLVRLFRVVAGTQSLTDAVIKDLHHRSISFDNLHFRMRIVESWWWALGHVLLSGAGGKIFAKFGLL